MRYDDDRCFWDIERFTVNVLAWRVLLGRIGGEGRVGREGGDTERSILQISSEMQFKKVENIKLSNPVSGPFSAMVVDFPNHSLHHNITKTPTTCPNRLHSATAFITYTMIAIQPNRTSSRTQCAPPLLVSRSQNPAPISILKRLSRPPALGSSRSLFTPFMLHITSEGIDTFAYYLLL